MHFHASVYPSVLLVFCLNSYFPFSLQPVRETREKQVQLWKELILEYCKSQKIFIIGLEQEFPLFTNSAIESNYFLHTDFFKNIYITSIGIYAVDFRMV